jgi:hypothetical protein
MEGHLVAQFDEPFADPSALPTYHVSKLARESVKVALSGDGDDELFLGYPVFQSLRLSTYAHRAPAAARRLLTLLPQLVRTPSAEWNDRRAAQEAGHSAIGQGNGDGIWTEWYSNLGSARYPWANRATGAWPDYYSPTMDLPPDLLFHFRVIDWTKWRGTATPSPKGRKHRKPASR